MRYLAQTSSIEPAASYRLADINPLPEPSGQKRPYLPVAQTYGFWPDWAAQRTLDREQATVRSAEKQSLTFG